MSIKDIKKENLRNMNNQEGLILQGCGGEVQEWIDGINELLTDENILLNGTNFTDVFRFTDGNHTSLLFAFNDDVKLDMGKLAIWRLKTHETFAGIWMSDYVSNRLGGFIQTDENKQERIIEKPNCKLIGEDGNIFNLMGIASRTLRQNGMSQQAKEMQARITSSGSYDKALSIIDEYVNIVGSDDYDNEMDEIDSMGVQMGGM